MNEDFLDDAIDYHLSNVHTCLPAAIEEYKDGFATVIPLIKLRTKAGNVYDLPKIYRVPVLFQRTDKVAISFPLVKGDTVTLIFSERSLDVWLDNGGNVDPKDTRKFDLTDAIAIPGLYAAGKGQELSMNDLTIRFNDSTIVIKENGKIEIGNDNLKAVITEDFLNHTHVFTGAVSGTACTGTTNSAVVSNCTTKTKVE
jgi:hypothetical protein